MPSELLDRLNTLYDETVAAEVMGNQGDWDSDWGHVIPQVRRIVVHCRGLGRVDLTGALALAETLEHLREAGFDVVVEEVPPHALRVLRGVGEAPDGQGV